MTVGRLQQSLLLVALVVGLHFATACSDGECAIGSESCSCTEGGACDPGLTCLSEVCVDASSVGGDGDGDGDGNTNGGGFASGPQIQQCVAACQAASDCALDFFHLDAEHWACEQNGCVYTGCNPQEGCESAGENGLQQTCTFPGTRFDQPRLCIDSCSTPSDCVQGNTADTDANNWTCSAGACIYRGCLNDQECEGWLCRRRPHERVDFCVPPCITPTDCVAFGDGEADIDSDNWDCVSGGCIYTGCNDDSECGAGASCHVRWPD